MDTKTLSIAELEQFDSRARQTGIERRFCCPFCGDGKPNDKAHQSLCVNSQTGLWNCKRCESKGILKEFWTNNTGVELPNKHKQIARAERTLKGSPPRPATDPNPESVERFLRERKKVQSFAGTFAEGYLLSRGIPANLAKAAHCKYSASFLGMGPSVIFPVFSESGEPIAMAGRAVCGSSKKTCGPRSLGVFLTPGALEADPVAITEAPIDALTLALAGIPAIALCGTSGIPAWIVKRFARPVRAGRSRTVYMAFDADAAGDKAAIERADDLILVKTPRLRPNGKDWNQDLMTGGLDSLRDWLESAGISGNRIEYPSESLEASESSPVASVKQSVCAMCGAAVVLNAYPEVNGWHWYECDSCGEAVSILPDSEEAVSESNPTPPFCDPGGECVAEPVPDPNEGTSPEETAARIEALAETIRAALAGRTLPIRINPGEVICGIDLYATAEARSVLSKSYFLSRPALERLALLGIDTAFILPLLNAA